MRASVPARWDSRCPGGRPVDALNVELAGDVSYSARCSLTRAAPAPARARRCPGRSDNGPALSPRSPRSTPRPNGSAGHSAAKRSAALRERTRAGVGHRRGRRRCSQIIATGAGDGVPVARRFRGDDAASTNRRRGDHALTIASRVDLLPALSRFLRAAIGFLQIDVPVAELVQRMRSPVTAQRTNRPWRRMVISLSHNGPWSGQQGGRACSLSLLARAGARANGTRRKIARRTSRRASFTPDSRL